jgi:tetratricopeptide (TPR) repeat protein
MLGNVEAEEGNLKAAQQLFEECVRRFRDLGDEHYTLLATRVLAWMCYDLGERERARTLHEEVVLGARATSNARMEATSLGALAEYDLYEGRAREAVSRLKEAFRINREVGEVPEIVVNLCRFARALALAGRPETALRLLSSSEALREKAGAREYAFATEMNEGTLTMIRARLDEAAMTEAWDQGRGLTADEAVALALDSLD